MHIQTAKRSLSARSLAGLALALPTLFLAGCLGSGDGPDSIAGTPATEVPTVPAGFCDAINFEVLCALPDILNFNGGVTTVVDNPDQSGINSSDKAAQMIKRNEEPFGGTRLNLESNVDFSAGLAFRMKVRASRAVPVLFKLEHVDGPASGVERVINYSGSGDWEELCFDFSGTAAFPAPAYTVIFDNGVLGQFATDPDNWTFNYDDILQVQSCEGAADAASITPAAGLFLTEGTPSLVIPDDYTEITAFGSGSIINTAFVDDETFSPALSVFSGTGYGANVAQVGFIGFRAGFLGEYQTIDFKVKGDLNASNSGEADSQAPQTRSLPSQIVFVRLFDGIDSLRINLTSSGFSEALENGWFQVSVPLSSFDDVNQEATGIVIESDGSAAEPFRMLLTDLGFSGDGGNAPIPADPGVIPDDVIYTSDSDEMIDLVFQTDYTTITGFESGSVFDDNVVTDDDFRPALAITTGDGYGAQVGQYALLGFENGFAATYESLVFKAKNLNNDIIRVRLLDSGEYLDIDLKMSEYSTALGNGWSQVVVPVSDLVGADTATGLLFETDNTAAESFTFLLTDFGFNDIVFVEPEIAEDDSVFSQDPNVMSAQAPPGGLQDFGSGATFETLTDDPDYDVVLQVNSGNNFGEGTEHVGFVAFTGYASGFAAGYETLNFKVRGDAANLTAFEVKFFPPDTSRIYDLTNYEGSTLLSNGWYQVSIPLSDLDASSLATGDGFLIGPQGDQGQAFSYRLTDIGFTGDSGNGGGVVETRTPLPVSFDEDPVPNITPFGGAVFGFEAGPAGSPGSGNALRITRNETVFAGLFVEVSGITEGTQTIQAFVHSPVAGIRIVAKLDEGEGAEVSNSTGDTEANETVVAGWQTLTWTFNVGAGIDYNRFVLLPNLGTTDTDGLYYVDDIAVADGSGGGVGGGGPDPSDSVGLVANSDFETGDFSGWETINNGGTISIFSPGSTGDFAANLNAPPGNNPTLKQTRIGAGQLGPNQEVTVSFDWMGTAANGGVVDIRIFSELDGDGGVTKTDVIQEGGVFPADWTTVGPISITTAATEADIAGGLTIQITAICGAVEGCISDLFIDNVIIEEVSP